MTTPLFCQCLRTSLSSTNLRLCGYEVIGFSFDFVYLLFYAVISSEKGNKMSSKKRGVNFTHEDKINLLRIIEKFKKIIENKETDAVTNKQKEEVWEKNCTLFNAQGSTARNVASLRKFYTNIKANLRKESAERRKELYLTGGGVCAKHKIDPVFDLASSFVNKKTIEGYENNYDGDRVPKTKYSADVGFDYINEITNFNNTITETTKNNEEFDLENMEIEIEPPCSPGLSSASIRPKALDWGNVNPTHLSTKKSDKLTSKWSARRRPQPPLTSSQISEQYIDLGKIKMEVAKLQLTNMKEEQEMNIMKMAQIKELHDAKMKLLLLEIELKEKEKVFCYRGWGG